MSKKMDEATRKRVRAGGMLLAGKRCADVAKAVGVARQTVYTWKAQLDGGGLEALRAVGVERRPMIEVRRHPVLRRGVADIRLFA